MTDRADNSGSQDNSPLFQNIDEGDGTLDREAVVGSEGTNTTPIVPAATTVTSAPVPVTAQPDLLTARDQNDRDREAANDANG